MQKKKLDRANKDQRGYPGPQTMPKYRINKTTHNQKKVKVYHDWIGVGLEEEEEEEEFITSGDWKGQHNSLLLGDRLTSLTED